jgi:hypothetical protein
LISILKPDLVEYTKDTNVNYDTDDEVERDEDNGDLELT